MFNSVVALCISSIWLNAIFNCNKVSFDSQQGQCIQSVEQSIDISPYYLQLLLSISATTFDFLLPVPDILRLPIKGQTPNEI